MRTEDWLKHAEEWDDPYPDDDDEPAALDAEHLGQRIDSLLDAGDYDAADAAQAELDRRHRGLGF